MTEIEELRCNLQERHQELIEKLELKYAAHISSLLQQKTKILLALQMRFYQELHALNTALMTPKQIIQNDNNTKERKMEEFMIDNGTITDVVITGITNIEDHREKENDSMDNDSIYNYNNDNNDDDDNINNNGRYKQKHLESVHLESVHLESVSDATLNSEVEEEHKGRIHKTNRSDNDGEKPHRMPLRKRIQCKTCLKYFTSNNSMLQHIDKIHGNKDNDNENEDNSDSQKIGVMPSRKRQRLSNLRIKRRGKEKAASFRCIDCDLRFYDEYKFYEHNKEYHLEYIDKSNTNNKQECVECVECFQCEECGKSFKTDSGLNIHRGRIHKNGKKERKKTNRMRRIDSINKSIDATLSSLSIRDPSNPLNPSNQSNQSITIESIPSVPSIPFIPSVPSIHSIHSFGKKGTKKTRAKEYECPHCNKQFYTFKELDLHIQNRHSLLCFN